MYRQETYRHKHRRTYRHYRNTDTRATHQALLARVAAVFAGGVSRHPRHGNADPRLGVIALEIDFVARDLEDRKIVCIPGIVGVCLPMSNGGENME